MEILFFVEWSLVALFALMLWRHDGLFWLGCLLIVLFLMVPVVYA